MSHTSHKIGDTVTTEVHCGTRDESGAFNINGSTFVKGKIIAIKGDLITLEITQTKWGTNLEVGSTIKTLIDQIW